jgi:hypothetical protein
MLLENRRGEKESEFNTRYVACRIMTRSEDQRVEGRSESKVLCCWSTLFNPPELIPPEAMGAMPCLQELQGVSVPDGQSVVQREH